MIIPWLLKMWNGKNYREQGLQSLRQSRDESTEGIDCVTSSGKYPDPLTFWLKCKGI